MNARRLSQAMLAGAFALQAAFWWNTRDMRPDFGLVPPVPTPEAMDALGFGDRQALYRVLALGIQNTGDDGGRFTPLDRYDYVRLGGWFMALDGLDPVSDFLPVVAGYHYSNTPKRADILHVVTYLRHHARFDPKRNWRWLAHGVYLAKHRMRDQRLALELARELTDLDVPDMPTWARQMQVFILADLGENEAARALMLALLKGDPNLSPEERNFMQHVLTTRLAR
ncbi:MAG: hypothetical protein HQL38_15015 [Alphaproteobacteria bacterium]|nr:hypothetical protein [Alphaproteobacteria bacterium]MBF0393987.1 hypothetical protein [Alphaproteobacteria bacterium]